MSLALVGDRKGIWPQNLCINYTFTPHGMYFPSVPLPSPTFLLLSPWWDGVKQDIWKDTLNSQSPGRMALKVASVLDITGHVQMCCVGLQQMEKINRQKSTNYVMV